MDAALALWKVLEADPLLAPDVFSYTALITAYGRAGQWDDAQKCFEEMSVRGKEHIVDTAEVKCVM